MDAKSGAVVLPQTVTINRKFKEKHDDTSSSRKTKEVVKEEIEEDYPELDPAPSTNSVVKSGPIVHDTSVTPDHPMKGHP